MDEQVLTVEEAARSLRIGRSKFYQLIASGQIASLAIGRRRLVTTRAIAEFLDRESAWSINRD